MNERGAAMVWCPFPNSTQAREAAQLLLQEKRIACANIFPATESLFEWDGEISASQEVGLLLKTTDDQLRTVIDRLKEVHPYEVPAILGWKCDKALPETLNWLSNTVFDG